MRLNEYTALSTRKLLLVPYSEHHVAQYHQWMQDPNLQAATASEPLTLAEEYGMQRSWRTDHDKLTFIACLPLEAGLPEDVLEPGAHDSDDRMIGDVNLFIFSPDDDDDDDDQPGNDSSSGTNGIAAHGSTLVGELELMIARKDLQGSGFGRAALVAFMHYVLSCWPQIAAEYHGSAGTEAPGQAPRLLFLRARIGSDNERSLGLFRSLGFVQTGEPNYFGEVELRWHHDLEYLKTLTCHVEPDVLRFGHGKSAV